MITLLDDGASGGRRHLAFALVIGAALVAASCGDSNLPTTPTTFGAAGSSSSSSSNVTINALSDNIVAQPVARAFCPTVSPFTVPFVVVVNSNGATGVVVNNFSMQFTDLAGTHQPSVTVPAPVPIQEFGTELTRARDMQFALSMGIGCGVGRSGVIVVSFDATDSRGHRSSGQTRISVQ
jgi:hypothetical protein